MGGTESPIDLVAEYGLSDKELAGDGALRIVVPGLKRHLDADTAAECVAAVRMVLERKGYVRARLPATAPADCAAPGAGGCEGPCGPAGPVAPNYLNPAPAVCEAIQEGLGLPWRWDTENLNLVTRDGETVIVSLRMPGGAIDVSGPDQVEAAQAIATALNAYYRANPASS